MNRTGFTLYQDILELREDSFVSREVDLVSDDEGKIFSDDTVAWVNVKDRETGNLRAIKLNTEGLQRATVELQHWREQLLSLPASEHIQLRASIFERIIGIYALWFRSKGLELPVSSGDPGKDAGSHRKRHKWDGSKSDFARHVTQQYELNPQEYSSLRHAAHQLFDEFEFSDSKWTKEKCYDMVRKL